VWIDRIRFLADSSHTMHSPSFTFFATGPLPNICRKTRHRALKTALVAMCFATSLVTSSAATMTWYGPAEGPDGSNAWPSSWTAVPSLNSPVNSGITGELDFVGDTTNPGFYLSQSSTFLFFRMRVNVPTVAADTFRDSHLVLIDVVGWNYPGIGVEGKPDFALTWDSRSNDPAKHGLEMQIPSTLGTTWGGVRI